LVSLKDLVRTLGRRKWVVILAIVLIEVLAVSSSLLEAPRYEASIKILVGQRGDVNPTIAPSVLDLQQLTLTMTQAVDSLPVAKAATKRLNLSMTPEKLLANLDSEALEVNDTQTQFIEVTYTDSDPQRAQRVVNAIGEAFSEQVSKVSRSTSAVTATVWESATVPEVPISPNPVRRALLGLLIGVMLGVGLAFVFEIFDDSWRSPEEAEQISGVVTLGVIPALGLERGKKGGSAQMARPLGRSKRRQALSEGSSDWLITISDPSGAASEAYRSLRTNLFYSIADDPPNKVILLAGPSSRIGKSTTCANLGVVLAQADRSTLMVDCDLRKPVLHKVFGLSNTYGLMNVLSGEYRPHEVWQEPSEGLHVLPAGPMPPNPAEVLASEHFARFLEQIRPKFDYVLLDAPPTQLVSDPTILAPQVDGVLLLFDAQSTRKDSVRQAIRGLKAVGANVLGTVMTNVLYASVDHYYQHYDAYTHKEL
jgi:capsular exopolysaccharide synthesis family protein